ncbi:hypothetical protein CUMW_092380 [Citrus unshiu]|nr:hypothetical protein CUMW_092380 [Citrus unshiu]
MENIDSTDVIDLKGYRWTEKCVWYCFRVMAENTGKSQMAMEKMVEGRLHKHYEDDFFFQPLRYSVRSWIRNAYVKLTYPECFYLQHNTEQNGQSPYHILLSCQFTHSSKALVRMGIDSMTYLERLFQTVLSSFLAFDPPLF